VKILPFFEQESAAFTLDITNDIVKVVSFNYENKFLFKNSLFHDISNDAQRVINLSRS
tara:strand:- start:2724 stop:2897 length:174 start_codon:yes stop_codon:yes gene_type:complete